MDTNAQPPARPGVRAGFSLIELLVVISIIAVLLGILLPALPAIRDSGRRAVCGVKLSSIGQAVEMYKQAHKEVFPLAKYMPAPWLSGSDLPGLPTALASFLEPDPRAWICPGDKVVAATPIEPTDPDKPANCSYTYVTALGGQIFERTFFARVLKLTASDTPITYDFDGGSFETQDGRLVIAPFFHRTRNVLFADNHVGKYDPQTFPQVPPSQSPGGTN